VNGDNVGTGVSELGNLAFWLFDHKVDIQRQVSPGADGSYYGSTDGDLGDEMTVHNIYVNVVGSGTGSFGYLFTKMSEVCREDGGGEFDLRFTLHLRNP